MLLELGGSVERPPLYNKTVRLFQHFKFSRFYEKKALAAQTARARTVDHRRYFFSMGHTEKDMDAIFS